MTKTYLAVVGRIRQELQELSQIVERTNRIWKKFTSSTDDDYLDGVALNLHGFYAGMERVFEIIADGVDQTKPTGINWHQQLLRQMATEIPSLRPPVLSSATRDALDRYRGFRHMVRNVYTFNLEPGQIAILVHQLRPTMEQATQELLAFANFLEQLVGNLPGQSLPQA